MYNEKKNAHYSFDLTYSIILINLYITMHKLYNNNEKYIIVVKQMHILNINLYIPLNRLVRYEYTSDK